MTIDRTTEAIAHFVGLFALSVEKMIQREQYSEFRAAQNARDDLEAINAKPFQINSGYRLKEYDPKLNYAPPPVASGSAQPATVGAVLIPQSDVANMPFYGPAGVGIVPAQIASAATIVVSYVLATPSSIVSVTVQLNNLTDNDSLGVGAEEMFVSAVYFDAMVELIAEVAESLQGFAVPVLPTAEEGWQGFAHDALDQIAAAAAAEDMEASQPMNASVEVITGEATIGITINGETADDVPELDDLLPAFFQDDEDIAPEDPGTDDDESDDEDSGDTASLTDEDMDITLSTQGGDSGNDSSDDDGAASPAVSMTLADEVTTTPDEDVAATDADTDSDDEMVSVASGTENADTPEPHDIDNDFEGGRPDSEWAVEDGHQIVAGANTQLNETQVASSWLDADVIAVQGDVIEVDAISQVNVMVGADVVDGQLMDAISTALNIVEIVETSSDAPVEEETEEEVAAADVAEETSTDDTDVGMDDDADIAEPDLDEPEPPLTDDPDPLPYEGLPTDSVVVRVDGDVLQINWTVQESYLNDHDSAVVTIGASATYIGLGDNDEFNQTFLTETGFNYDLIFVGGDMIDVNMITQTNVLLDGGTVDTNGLEDVVDVVSGENLQFNLATINTVGIDNEADLEDAFEDTLTSLAEGAEEVSDEVEHNDLFEGTELLRVLYVGGDLTTVNVVIQNNVLGDVDQLNVAHAAIEAAQNLEGLAESITADVEAEIEIITGSNAQANVALLNDFGVDSTVMAGGDFYSDALIHQADLIDTDAIPDGVELAGLVNEAVAFLADDLVADLSTLSDDIIAGTNASMTDIAGTADIMQTVLS